MKNLPNHSYYTRDRGHWKSKFQFRITSWKMFWRTRMNVIDRVRVVVMEISPKFFCDVTVRTRVDYGEGSNQVRHQRRVSQFGLLFYRSQEVFELDPDGHHLKITGHEVI